MMVLEECLPINVSMRKSEVISSLSRDYLTDRKLYLLHMAGVTLQNPNSNRIVILHSVMTLFNDYVELRDLSVDGILDFNISSDFM